MAHYPRNQMIYQSIHSDCIKAHCLYLTVIFKSNQAKLEENVSSQVSLDTQFTGFEFESMINSQRQSPSLQALAQDECRNRCIFTKFQVNTVVEPLNMGLRENEESFACKAMLLKEYSCFNILQIAIHARQKVSGSCEVYQCKLLMCFQVV